MLSLFDCIHCPGGDVNPPPAELARAEVVCASASKVICRVCVLQINASKRSIKRSVPTPRLTRHLHSNLNHPNLLILIFIRSFFLSFCSTRHQNEAITHVRAKEAIAQGLQSMPAVSLAINLPIIYNQPKPSKPQSKSPSSSSSSLEQVVSHSAAAATASHASTGPAMAKTWSPVKGGGTLLHAH